MEKNSISMGNLSPVPRGFRWNPAHPGFGSPSKPLTLPVFWCKLRTWPRHVGSACGIKLLGTGFEGDMASVSAAEAVKSGLIPNTAELEVNKLFRACVKQQASDLHLKVGRPPMVRVNGIAAPLDPRADRRRRDGAAVLSADERAEPQDFRRRMAAPTSRTRCEVDGRSCGGSA